MLVTLSQHEEGSIPALAATICGRNPSTKAWLNHDCLDLVLKECYASRNFFKCAESKAWKFEDIIIGAQKGYVLKKSLTNTTIWRRENLNNWICYTLDVGGTIGSNATIDELYIFLNHTMEYIFYIHSHTYFVQNYVPSLIPINRFKLFSDACSSFFQLTLTEQVEMNTVEDPCHLWLKQMDRPSALHGYGLLDTSCYQEKHFLKILSQIGQALLLPHRYLGFFSSHHSRD